MKTPLQTFCENMLLHFRIPRRGGAVKYICPISTAAKREPRLDILKLDELLHKRHGDYEDQGLSMSDLITKEYGEEANQFVRQQIGLPRE